MWVWMFVKLLVVNVACVACVIGGYEVMTQLGKVSMVDTVGIVALFLTVVQTAFVWADQHENPALSEG